MKINQILPALSYGDAVGNDAIEIRNSLRRMGYESEIYAKHIHPKVNKFAKQLKNYRKDSANIVIYHFSLAGFDVTDFVRNLPDMKILIYHNITPHHYLKNINDTLYNLCRYGREELNSLNKVIKLALGDSEYNRKELELNGFNDTGVLPIMLDFSKYRSKPDKKIIEKYDDDYVNLVFVGRISPNKKQDEIIRIFYYYKMINPKSRLILVGSHTGMDTYFLQLIKLVEIFNLKNDVVFTGHVNFEEMIAYYHIADVFLCMSEHEGFCVPLLESMYFNIPIIAYNSTAIPDTLGNCGVLVNEKKYDEIAEMINLVITNASIREKIIFRQNERFNDFDKAKIEEKLKNYIDPFINSTKE